MIHPYTVGPMALSGIAWYQGEQNVDGPSATVLNSLTISSCQFEFESNKVWKLPLILGNFNRKFDVAHSCLIYWGMFCAMLDVLAGRTGVVPLHVPEAGNELAASVLAAGMRYQ
jgi:hypothetical protein